MPQISSIQHPVQAAAARISAPQGAQVPATLRNARPSTGAIFGRVIAGIFTLGISEGIIRFYKHCQAKSAAASRLNAAAPDIP